MNIPALLIATALLLTALTGTSSAASFDEFKMVGSYGSTVTQTTFSHDQVPFLYYKVTPAANAEVKAFWYFEGETKPLIITEITTTADSIGWLNLSNWNDEGGAKKLGNWTVSGTLKVGTRLADSDRTTFTAVVTPEPLSMVLYGLGGLPIAAHLIRRRKTAA